MPDSSIARATASVISWLRSQTTSPVLGWIRVRGREAADHSLLVGALLVAGDLGRLGPSDPAAFLGAAVFLAGDHVLGHVHQTAGQITRVGGAKGRVREALAGTVGGDEVLENRHAFAEVAPHRHVDDTARRVGHQASHTAELADLALVTSRAGVGHHPHGAVRIEAVHHLGGQVVGGLLPDVDDLLVALVIGDEAALELAVDLVDGGVRRDQASGLVLGDHDVADRDGHATAGRVGEADALDAVDDRSAVSAGPRIR
jgi:hypothetical protein